MKVSGSVGELEELLNDTARKHGVPGAVLSILDGDRIDEASTGVTNKNTGVEVTPDTLFQIGSITKVYTATLVMQLVDEEQLELDGPVRRYLPEFRVADESATETITVRHLISHCSGIDGDFFEDTGRGDDCVEKYVYACSRLPQIAPPGHLFSYCNAGFVVAGRLIERITGQTWHDAVRERVVTPLGLTKTTTLPEEALLHRAAVGHVINPQDPAGDLLVAPRWVMPYSLAPAGFITCTARDLLQFVRLHLDAGIATNGKRLLTKGAVRAMQQSQIDLPLNLAFAGNAAAHTGGNGWGLGWSLLDWAGVKTIGHDGETIGQSAFLRVVPDQNFAVALLANAPPRLEFWRDVFVELFANHGIEIPSLPEATTEGLQFDSQMLEGEYDRVSVKTRIEAMENGLTATLEFEGILAALMPLIKRVPLRPVDSTTFLIRLPTLDRDTTLEFLDFGENAGRPRYLHLWGRASRRTQSIQED